MIAGLEARTREAFPDDPDATHLDYVDLWLSSGKIEYVRTAGGSVDSYLLDRGLSAADLERIRAALLV